MTSFITVSPGCFECEKATIQIIQTGSQKLNDDALLSLCTYPYETREHIKKGRARRSVTSAARADEAGGVERGVAGACWVRRGCRFRVRSFHTEFASWVFYSSSPRSSMRYFTICPTMFLSLHPDYVLIHRIERIDTGNSNVICQFLFPPESSDQQKFAPDQAIEFWDITNRQDWEVCELAQNGMSDPAYQPGPYSDLESVVAAFDRNYLSEMKFKSN